MRTAATGRWEHVFSYNRTLAICSGMVVGLAPLVPVLVAYIKNGGRPAAGRHHDLHHVITGLWLVIASFQTFVFILLQRATAMLAARLREVTGETGARRVDGAAVRAYFATLASHLEHAAATLGAGAPVEVAEAMALVIEHARQAQATGHKLVFVGNGGSARIASHAPIDYTKAGSLRALGAERRRGADLPRQRSRVRAGVRVSGPRPWSAR